MNNSQSYEMPVTMALMMAQTENAVSSFAKMDDERKMAYIKRARASTSREEMANVVKDIVKIG